MDETQLKKLLQGVKEGGIPVSAAMEELKDFPVAEMGFAQLDTHRNLRRGFPETILAEGKATNHLISIVRKALESHKNIIITRTNESQRKVLSESFPEEGYGEFLPSSLVTFSRETPAITGQGTIGVVSAGTSDIPVAREAIETAKAMGNHVEEIFDVGVAGLHRILRQLDLLRSCRVVIVVAGMDGALPSVVAGLLHVPVIAVPTSVGYGASFGGVAALLTMLNSCASGVTVVNIDNGFGAAVTASLINHPPEDNS